VNVSCDQFIHRGFVAAVLAILLFVGMVSAVQDDLDDLGLEETERVTQDQFLERLDNGLRERDPTNRRTALLGLLDVLLRNDNIILKPRDRDRFAAAVLEAASPADLQPYAAKLIVPGNNLAFDLGAQARLNLGIRFALVTGNASLEQLTGLLKQHEKLVDLEWLLPAIGKTGGADTLPLLQRYRQDQTIIAMGNYQNIRRVPCAAVLACAYAGDESALQLILDWYEQDVTNLPRFAFYVQWGRQEGMDTRTSEILVAYCQHRISQAERLLEYLGTDRLPALIERSGNEFRISLTGYMLRQLRQTNDPDVLAAYMPMLDHPSTVVKQQVFTVFANSGNTELRDQALKKVYALLRSPHGTDRFFAVTTLWSTADADLRRELQEQIDAETNLAVKRRLLNE